MALDGSGNITISWPCDCDAQAAVTRTMLIDIEAQDTLIRANGRKQIIIFADSVPSQGQWNTQWLLQGNSLPITKGVEGLWYDTINNTYGAQYYTINGVMYPVEMIRYKGLTFYQTLNRYYSTSTNLNVQLKSPPLAADHWSYSNPDGDSFVNAAGVDWVIPTQLVGKNYSVKFYIPFVQFSGTASPHWTVWYENTNYYFTLYGGAFDNGFGAFPNTLGIVKVIEWTVEVPAGGTNPTIGVRIAPISGQFLLYLPPIDGSNGYTGLYGRASAEFSLKTE